MPERVLITGAGCRIGKALAIHLAFRGCDVIVHCHHSLTQAEQLLKILPGAGHSLVQGDLCERSFCEDLVKRLCDEGRAPSVLINNASVYARECLSDVTWDEAEASMRINFLAPFELMRQFRKWVGHGCIINITDQRNAYLDPKSGMYGVAKKSLQAATEAAALEWAPNVRVNAIAPGLVMPPPGKTWDKMRPLLDKVPLRRRAEESELAQAVFYLMDNPSVTGQTLFVDGGLHLMGHSVES